MDILRSSFVFAYGQTQPATDRDLTPHLYTAFESLTVTQLASLHQKHSVVGGLPGLARKVETRMPALSSWILCQESHNLDQPKTRK